MLKHRRQPQHGDLAMTLTIREIISNASGFAIALAAVTLSSVPCQAAVIRFTDRAAWEAAVGSFLTEDFNAIAPFRFRNNTTTTVGLLDIETVVPDGSTGFARITDGTSTSAKNVDGTNFLNLQLDGTPKSLVSFDFSDPMQAWGFDYSFTDFGNLAEVSFGNFTTKFGGPGQSGFIGFISDTAFASADLKDPHVSFSALGVDNVSFAQMPAPEPASTPEPSAALASLIILGVGAAMKRKGFPKVSQ